MKRKKIKVAPYSRLARIYDEVMAHVDYKLWAKYVLRILKRNKIKLNYLLDISCGTGSFLLELFKSNCKYFGCDFSFEMLQRAKTKSRGKEIHYFLSDMTNFAVKQQFNAVVCLYDSINYILDPTKWLENFCCVYDALQPKGLYIFDICTELNSVKYFDNYTEQGAGYGYRYVRESFFDKEKRIHHNKFFIEFDEEEDLYIEDHQQIILSVDQVISMIESTPFTLLDFYDGFTFQQGGENSLRVHFVLRK